MLSRSAASIDFLAIHDYPCWKWGSYAYYEEHTPRFTEAVDRAVTALEAYCDTADVKRIGLAITEMGSVDWDGHPKNLGWPHVNSLGHALVLVDMIGRCLSHPRLDFALLWNTRWVENDSASPPQLWDAVDPTNGLNPTGMAMALWEGASEGEVCACECAELPAFALRANGGLSVVVINKRGQARELAVRVEGAAVASAGARALHGVGPDSPRAWLAELPSPSVTGGEVRLSAAPYSALRIDLCQAAPR